MAYLIGLDFDGTVVEHAYPAIGKENPGALEWLRQVQKAGAKIILNTIRSGDRLDEAVNFLEVNGIHLFGANKTPGQSEWSQSPKVYAHIYVDDAALGTPLVPGDQFPDRMRVDWTKVGPDLYSKTVAHQLTGNYTRGLHIDNYDGTWVFSDLSVGLVDEPFVQGADILLDTLVQGISDYSEDRGIVAEFSHKPFSGFDVELLRDKIEDPTGNWYTDSGTNRRAWLCPALYKYFAIAPETLYIKVHPCK